jgi:hypothetical protein
VQLFSSKYVLELFYYGETFRIRFFFCVFTSNSVLLFGMIHLLSVVDSLVAVSVLLFVVF